MRIASAIRATKKICPRRSPRNSSMRAGRVKTPRAKNPSRKSSERWQARERPQRIRQIKSRGNTMQEGSWITGIFTAWNVGPRSGWRKQFLTMIADIAALETSGQFGKAMALQARSEKLLEIKWSGEAPNVVCTVGKNVMLDNALAGSGYTVVGPFMGLISAVSFTSGPAAGDTMAAHGGWTEAGGTNAPTYTAPRKTAAWSAASGGAKALSAALQFAITSSGTVKGCFLTYGTGALSTIDNTAGTLYSAGTFTGGDKVVGNGDTLNVSYSTSL